MGFLKNLLGKKETPKKTNVSFWDWFQENGQHLYQTVKRGEQLEEKFFDQLMPKLAEEGEGFYCLTGMHDEYTAELILTADGVAKNIPLVKELAAAAPNIPNWKITALKPPFPVETAGIFMEGYAFNSNTLSFYPAEHPQFPDEIDIVVVHQDFKETDRQFITQGVYIFIDNYLGELNSATTIDNLSITSPDQADGELIPIDKLKDYLVWREKEFVEKYNDTRHHTENDTYSAMEGQLENGLPLFAIINTTLLDWDGKASHPWILTIDMRYDGSNNNGMPDDPTYQLLDQIEDETMGQLKDMDGYLNIGRETVDGKRTIFFACRDFRRPILMLRQLQQKYADQLAIHYDIFKDKYWQSLEHFRPDQPS